MLLDDVRNELRIRHYSRRTEDAYLGWIKRYIVFSGKRHPLELGEREAQRFLTHLAVDRRVSASTQNQAMCAVLFLYRDVLKAERFALNLMDRAQRPSRLPVVLTKQEVRAILDCLQGETRLIAGLLYGAGLRLMECLTLRVKDLDFARSEIVVRDGKGQKDRLWATAHNLSYVPQIVMWSGGTPSLRRQGVRDDYPAHNYLALKEAMSLSAGRKDPRFSDGGTIAWIISSFWDGSARRYASVVWMLS